MPPMSRTVEAIYEDGVLKPLEPLGLPEHARTRVTVEEKGGPLEALEPEGPLPADMPLAAIGDSGRTDISERAEELLVGFGED